jgi:hypothetical protein
MNAIMGPRFMRNSVLSYNQAVARTRQKATYSLIELVRPDGYDAYSIEQQFQIFRWMVATAKATVPTKAETGRWGASDALCVLATKPTCVNGSVPLHIHSIEDLHRHFHYALLARDIGPSAHRWRRENRISVTETHILHFPHYAPFAGAPLHGKPTAESEIAKAFDGLMKAGGRLTTQLNSCHAGAVEIYGVTVHVRPQGFSFVLDYGYEGSIWYHTLTETPGMWAGEGETFHYNAYGRKSEPLIDTLSRAIEALEALKK